MILGLIFDIIYLKYCQATGTGTWDLGPGTWDLGPGNRIENQELRIENRESRNENRESKLRPVPVLTVKCWGPPPPTTPNF